MPAIPKPARGTAQKAKRARRRAVVASERSEKAKVRTRDRGCRWPGCLCGLWRLWGAAGITVLEVSHLRAKGMGGDHGLRSTADNMILLCHDKHQGLVSLHSGRLRIVPLTDAGTDGPCRFQIKETGRWRNVAAERAVGVLR